MIIDRNSSVDYKDWIEVAHDGNRQVTDQLMKTLKSTKIDDFRSIHYIGEDVYVKGVAYNESTRVLTFTLSDGSSLSVKLASEVDLSGYATKEDLNSKVDKMDGKSLSTNDFTNEDKEKLNSLSNYDDSELKSILDTKADGDNTYTKSEVDNLVSSINTNLSWKESVPTYSDIFASYPNPKDGWTVNVDDTDITYRYTGTEWIAISANSIPLATSELDGRMSKEDKAKLDDLSNYDDSSLISKVDLKADKEYVDSEISELDSKSVKFSEFTYGGDPKVRKTIQLDNYDSISSVSTTGVGVNVAMVNKWDVVDLGSPSLPINLNTPKGVRPTAQEPGQSGEEANKLAYLSDLDNLATKDELSSAIESIPEPIDSYTKSEVDSKLLEKVDVAPGMQLSHNDFTTDEKVKLASIEPDSYALKSELPNKVDKVEGKGLSTNDFTDEYKTKLDGLDNYDDSEVKELIDTKVDKVEGKVLSANDFTNEDKEKLNSLSNYDDSELKALIDTKANSSDVYTKEEIDSLPHIDSYSKSEVDEIAKDIESKITDHVDAYTKAESDAKYVTKESDKVLSSNDFTDEDKTKLGSLNNYDDSELKTLIDTKANSSDVYTKAEVDSLPHIDSYSKSEVDEIVKEVESKITEHTDAYTKVESDAKYVIRESNKGLSTNDFTDEYKTKLDGLDNYDDSEVKELIDTKVDKVEGKVLSSNDFTDENKSKLAGIEEGAQVNKIESIKVNGSAQEISVGDKSVNLDLTGKADIEDVYSKDEINSKLEKTVTWNYSVSEPEKKVITLDNCELIMGRTNPDSEIQPDPATSALTIAQVNKWNIIDLGSPKSVINFNIHKGYRPTVQESGQSGEEAHKIAYVSDIPSGDITSLLSRLAQLEERVSNLNKTDLEPAVIEGTPSEEYNDSTKDYQVSGTMTSGTSIGIEGKSVSMDNSSLSNNTRLKLKASGDVDIKNSTVSGDFPKANGNAAISIDNSGYIVIKDMTIDATLYNAIEIGLATNSSVKGVLIDNCKFRGQFSNNAILIFGTSDNSVININNCYFENVSNCIRISNKYNAKCTINITNCTCDKWDTNSPWQGLMILQDYTSKSLELEESNNLFGKDKVTINISNFTGPSGKLETPADISSICGTGDENQVVYVWNSVGESIPYGDGSRYPSINIV